MHEPHQRASRHSSFQRRDSRCLKKTQKKQKQHFFRQNKSFFSSPPKSRTPTFAISQKFKRAGESSAGIARGNPSRESMGQTGEWHVDKSGRAVTRGQYPSEALVGQHPKCGAPSKVWGNIQSVGQHPKCGAPSKARLVSNLPARRSAVASVHCSSCLSTWVDVGWASPECTSDASCSRLGAT